MFFPPEPHHRPFTRDPILLSRLFFVLLATLVGCYIGLRVGNRAIEFSLIAFSLAGIFVVFEHATNFVSSKSLLFASAGAFMGLIFSSMVHPAIPREIVGDKAPPTTIALLSHLIFCYLGMALALRHVDRFSFQRLNFIMSRSANQKVLDSSSLIDARVLNVVDSRFLEGPFIIPSFVLSEIRALADSSTYGKRQRGKRALDTIEALKKRQWPVHFHEVDLPDEKTDDKLVRYCVNTHATLVTNDANLQKHASIRRVPTLNLNELANMMKPTAYVGEEVELFLLRPGRAPLQAAGYLDDGSLVVVENASIHVGQKALVEIHSVHNRETGRIIFARLVRVLPMEQEPDGQPTPAPMTDATLDDVELDDDTHGEPPAGDDELTPHPTNNGERTERGTPAPVPASERRPKPGNRQRPRGPGR